MRKKICLIDYDMSDWGGTEQVIKNLALAFKEKYDVSIVSLCGGLKEKYDGIDCFTVIRERARIRKILSLGYIKLIKLINNIEVDVVIVCGTCAAFIIAMMRPFIAAKIIFADHLALCNELSDKPITLMRYIAAMAADHTVVLTHKSRNDYIRYFHYKSTKISCIYNWIDPSVFSYVDVYKKEIKKIITVGRLEHQKGYDMLIKTAAIVLKKHPDWEWHVFGSGLLLDEISSQIEREGLKKQLILMGATNRILELYKDYSFYVMTSYYEGLPLVLLEAKANRLPLISFNIQTGPADIIVDGVNGFLVEEKNVLSLAESIEKLIQDKELRDSFSEHAYDNIIQFEQNTILEQWNKLIDHMMT